MRIPSRATRSANYRRVVALCVLLGLGLQALLPFLQRSWPMANGAGPVFARHCIPDQEQPGHDGVPAKAPHKTAPCPICVAAYLAATAFAPPLHDLAPPPPHGVVAVLFPIAQSASDRHHHSPHSPRAPPILS